jgi:anthranilate synthase/aminodeoxychorismate synthase-like glutamine amidotransferase
MIVLIDNYDSFVFNLARYFERLGQPTLVLRNDAATNSDIAALRPDAVVISPGPCTPAEAGCSIPVIQKFAGQIPILGVCLGHQAIAAAFGGNIIRAAAPMHGRTSQVQHSAQGIFAGLPSPLVACRYHSLIVDRPSLPAELEVTAWTAGGTIMGLAHRRFPVIGVQFHPESILTDLGYSLLTNFLQLAGMQPASSPSIEDERAAPQAPAPLPSMPVTF